MLESSIKSYLQAPHGTVAVFPSLFHYSPNDDHYKGLIHQCWPVDIMLHANAAGYLFDGGLANEITMQMNTCPVVFKMPYDSADDVFLVNRLRGYQKFIPLAYLTQKLKYVTNASRAVFDSHKLYDFYEPVEYQGLKKKLSNTPLIFHY